MYQTNSESMNDQNPFFIGTVVDNEDPLYCYRVKVRLPIVHDNISDEDLPWAARVDTAFRGIKANTSPLDQTAKAVAQTAQNSVQPTDSQGTNVQSEKKTPPNFDHCVPEKGTQILVLAIQNDMNSLVYLGALYTKTDNSPTDKDPYLETYGVYGESKQFIGIDGTNKKDNEIKVHFIGHVDVDKVKKITVNAEDDIQTTTKKNITKKAEENITFTAKKNITIEATGDNVEITIINNKGNVNVYSKTLTANITEDAKVICKSLTCNASEKATVISDNILLDGNVKITGDLKVSESIKASGEVSALSGLINLSSHIHGYEPYNTTRPIG